MVVAHFESKCNNVSRFVKLNKMQSPDIKTPKINPKKTEAKTKSRFLILFVKRWEEGGEEEERRGMEGGMRREE